RTCRCTECTRARLQNCDSPFRCLTRAGEILRALPHKWNPSMQQPEDADEERELPNGLHFDNRITTTGSLTDAFRIFTEGATTN
ncbi:hypothetical protein EV360DRAFT_25337, partial [Lentinula raphanica]